MGPCASGSTKVIIDTLAGNQQFLSSRHSGEDGLSRTVVVETERYPLSKRGHMSPNARLIVGLGVIELGLAAIWFWLANVAAESANTPDAQVVIGQIMGGAMGLFFALGCVIFFVRRSRQKGS